MREQRLLSPLAARGTYGERASSYLQDAVVIFQAKRGRENSARRSASYGGSPSLVGELMEMVENADLILLISSVGSHPLASIQMNSP